MELREIRRANGKKVTIDIPIESSGTEFIGTVKGLPVNIGSVFCIYSFFPNVTNTVSYSLQILDTNDNILFAPTDNFSKNAVGVINTMAMAFPIETGYKVKLVTSGDCGSSGMAKVSIFYMY